MGIRRRPRLPPVLRSRPPSSSPYTNPWSRWTPRQTARNGRKGKVKVRFEDGAHPGLEEYVSTRQLVCAWSERKAVARDEDRAARLDDYVRRSGIGERALVEATNAVLASSSEPGAAAEAITALDERELQRILDRAGIETDPVGLHAMACRNRRGMIHMPLGAAIGVAK